MTPAAALDVLRRRLARALARRDRLGEIVIRGELCRDCELCGAGPRCVACLAHIGEAPR
jgi:hypothetical protein